MIAEYTRLIDIHEGGGAVHIIADDANVRDSDLDWCEKEAAKQCEDCGGPCMPALDLIRALRPLSPHDRLRACGFGEEYISSIDPVTGEWDGTT